MDLYDRKSGRETRSRYSPLQTIPFLRAYAIRVPWPSLEKIWRDERILRARHQDSCERANARPMSSARACWFGQLSTPVASPFLESVLDVFSNCALGSVYGRRQGHVKDEFEKMRRKMKRAPCGQGFACAASVATDVDAPLLGGLVAAEAAEAGAGT